MRPPFAPPFVLALALAPFLPRLARAQPPRELPVEEHRLANGLRVRLAPDEGLDEVSVVVRYGAGSDDDPPGKEGLAHLVEHMLFRGSRHVPAGFHREALERAGGSGIGARTHLDYTTYEETFPSEALALALWLESDRMGFAVDAVEASAVKTERAILANERRDRVANDPGTFYRGVLADEVYPSWHPYHAGDDDELNDASVEALDARDVQAYLRTWYVPSNATLAIAGRFDAAAAMALVTKYFGSLGSASVPARPALPERQVSVRIDYAAPVIHEYVAMAWPTPAYDTPDDRALDVVAALLFGPGSALRRRLVGDGLANLYTATEASHARGSAFWMTALVNTGVSRETVTSEMLGAVASIGGGVTPADLARTKRALVERARLRLDTPAGRARVLAGSPSADPWRLRSYDAIDGAAVASAARTWLDASKGAAVVVHAVANAPRSGLVLDRTEMGR